MRRTLEDKTGGDPIGGEELLLRRFASLRAKIPELEGTEFVTR
jgi:hypothetical protein